VRFEISVRRKKRRGGKFLSPDFTLKKEKGGVGRMTTLHGQPEWKKKKGGGGRKSSLCLRERKLKREEKRSSVSRGRKVGSPDRRKERREGKG